MPSFHKKKSRKIKKTRKTRGGTFAQRKAQSLTPKPLTPKGTSLNAHNLDLDSPNHSHKKPSIWNRSIKYLNPWSTQSHIKRFIKLDLCKAFLEALPQRMYNYGHSASNIVLELIKLIDSEKKNKPKMNQCVV